MGLTSCLLGFTIVFAYTSQNGAKLQALFTLSSITRNSVPSIPIKENDISE